MHFTVTGEYFDEPYALTWEDGIVVGEVAADLEAAEGTEVELPPVGPTRVLHLDDPLSVITWLHARTKVDGWDGELPEAPADAEVPDGAVP